MTVRALEIGRSLFMARGYDVFNVNSLMTRLLTKKGHEPCSPKGEPPLGSEILRRLAESYQLSAFASRMSIETCWHDIYSFDTIHLYNPLKCAST